MKMPHVGLLRARIVLQRESPVAQGGGSYAVNWVDVANLWAQIEPVSGREVLQEVRLESRVTHRIILRYRSDVNAGMRVVWGARVFSVQAVINLGERDRFTQLLAMEGGAV